MTEQRYKRLIQLGWDRETLKNAKVLVVGAGALGNEVLKNLALLGVGNIWVVDMDIIEDHNLTRTILFDSKDIGAYKSEVAAERVRQIDPSINIHSFIGKVQDVMGLGAYREMDVVFGCIDNIQARIDVNRYCYQTGTLFIDAGLRKLDGDVKVFAPPYEVCFDCTITQYLRNEAWQRFSCLKLRTREEEGVTIPTSPTISSIMAGWQVQIAVKYLHDASIPTNKRISVFGNIDDVNVSKLSYNHECPTHNLYDPIPEEVIELPYTSDTLTVGELLERAQKEFGTEEVNIDIGYDLILKLYCNEHDYRKPVFRKRGTLFVDEVECPHCLAEGKTSIDSLMLEYFTTQIDSREKENFLDQTLAAIGIPIYHIMKAKTFQDGQLNYKYFLIAGDRKRIFGEEIDAGG